MSQAPTGERMAPLYCPYCGDEDLRPLDAEPGRFACASCRRGFAVRFIGLTRE